MTYRFLYGVRFVWVPSLSSDTSQKNRHPLYRAFVPVGTGDADSDQTQGAEAITLSVAAAAPVSALLQSSVVAAKNKLTLFRPIVCGWKVEGGLAAASTTRFQWTPERRHLALTWVLRQRTFPQKLPRSVAGFGQLFPDLKGTLLPNEKPPTIDGARDQINRLFRGGPGALPAGYRPDIAAIFQALAANAVDLPAGLRSQGLADHATPN